MSGISSGIGLISGIDRSSLIDQLMAIEARPVTLLQARLQRLDIQRTAYLGISANLLSVQNSASRFSNLSFFRQFLANSSDESVATATAGEDAAPGSYSFRVHSLVSSHAVVSRGFADSDTTPVGAGTLTFESMRARVAPDTELDSLNSGEGVRRGVIRITDRTGAREDIDLSFALTVTDVLEAINSATDIQVKATVSGDGITVEDVSGGDTSDLIIADVGDGAAAADLGLAGRFETGRIEGAGLVRLTERTALDSLNDGNGVGRIGKFSTTPDLHFTGTQASFSVNLSNFLAPDTDLRVVNSGRGVRFEDAIVRITDRSGASAEINFAELPDPSGRTTVQQVLDAINESGIGVRASVVNSAIQISDTSGAPEEIAQELTIEDVSGHAAADLGIEGSTEELSLAGRDIHRVSTIGDVINAINRAPDNNMGVVQASLSADGKGITLRSLLDGNVVTVASAEGSQAGMDLGIEGAAIDPDAEPFTSRALIAGLNTVLLRTLSGGAGIDAGRVLFTVGGDSLAIDFTGAQTLSEVIERINGYEPAEGEPELPLSAAINRAGNGIKLTNTSEEHLPVRIDDESGGLMQAMGLLGTIEPGDDLDGGNLQRQYITRSTHLDDLNGGRGVDRGTMRITDSLNGFSEFQLPSNITTVGELIDFINRSTREDAEGRRVTARINDNGDGILLTDPFEGPGALTVADIGGGRAAKDLRLDGAAKTGETSIDGSFEIRVDVSNSDSLEDVARKIEESSGDFSASITQNPGRENPFSLSVTSRVSGRRGEMVLDAGGVDLGLSTLTRARDAIVLMGGDGDSASLLIASPSNTLTGAINDVTVDLLAAGADFDINVAQDVDSIVESVRGFVDEYNEVQTAINQATAYNAETQQRGPLLGDSTADIIRNRLIRLINRPYDEADETVSRLFQIGIRGASDNKIEFNEVRFRDAYENNPEGVERLFTAAEVGFGTVVKAGMEELTRDFDGVLARKEDVLADQKELINDRIDRLNVLLAAKRARLEAQFVNLESVLAGLQDQQNALSVLSARLASGG